MPKGWKRRGRRDQTLEPPAWVKRRGRLELFTKVARPVTWADPEMVVAREKQRAAREWREYQEMQREMGWRREEAA